MKCIAVINQKGGVGKTTTAANLGVALARRRKRVLLIDLDPQAHLTIHLGTDPDSPHPNSYTLLTDQQPLCDVWRAVEERLWMIPSHLDLAAAETELASVIGRETLLKDALDELGDHFDYVLIDCPPSLGVLTLNGLCAANEVLIPMQAHFLALQGVSKLLQTIEVVHRRINPGIRVRGVLLCMYEASTRLGTEVAQDLSSFFAESREGQTPWSTASLLETVIRRNIKLAECPSHGLSVFDYAPRSHGALDYASLADELLAIYDDRETADEAVSLFQEAATVGEATREVEAPSHTSVVAENRMPALASDNGEGDALAAPMPRSSDGTVPEEAKPSVGLAAEFSDDAVASPRSGGEGGKPHCGGRQTVPQKPRGLKTVFDEQIPAMGGRPTVPSQPFAPIGSPVTQGSAEVRQSVDRPRVKPVEEPFQQQGFLHETNAAKSTTAKPVIEAVEEPQVARPFAPLVPESADDEPPTPSGVDDRENEPHVSPPGTAK